MRALENVFIQIPSFIFWKDTRSRFLGCNLPFARAAGLNNTFEIRGKTDFELAWADTHAKLYQEGDQQVLDGILMHNVLEPQLQANGKLNIILINKIPLLDKRNQKIGIIGCYTEIGNPSYNGKFDSSKKNIAITKKQSECLFYLAKGMSIKQVANYMGISVRTAEYHTEILKTKFNCRTKSSLIAKALELDFIKIKLLAN